MLSLYTLAAMCDALHLPLDPQLHQLLNARVQDIVAKGLADMTHIIIVQPGDTEGDVIAEVGFSPLVNRTDGRRFGDPNFDPDWDWLELYDGWWIVTYTVGNSGFAYIILIPDKDGTPSELLALCRSAPCT